MNTIGITMNMKNQKPPRMNIAYIERTECVLCNNLTPGLPLQERPSWSTIRCISFLIHIIYVVPINHWFCISYGDSPLRSREATSNRSGQLLRYLRSGHLVTQGRFLQGMKGRSVRACPGGSLNIFLLDNRRESRRNMHCVHLPLSGAIRRFLY